MLSSTSSMTSVSSSTCNNKKPIAASSTTSSTTTCSNGNSKSNENTSGIGNNGAIQGKRLHVSNIPFRFRSSDLWSMFGVSFLCCEHHGSYLPFNYVQVNGKLWLSSCCSWWTCIQCMNKWCRQKLVIPHSSPFIHSSFNQLSHSLPHPHFLWHSSLPLSRPSDPLLMLKSYLMNADQK